MSSCKEHRNKPAWGYRECPGCEVEALRAQLTATQRELEQTKQQNKALLEQVEDLIELSMNLDEHPEDYDGPCLCKTCQSYVDVDENALAARGGV